mmetsp:Transcript_1410/g.4192  ORF Transcript_1410/g.4192 Transcript_1410/m.4192 type:complete len:485 (-) Transcript_1410:1707-3161(-)
MEWRIIGALGNPAFGCGMGSARRSPDVGYRCQAAVPTPSPPPQPAPQQRIEQDQPVPRQHHPVGRLWAAHVGQVAVEHGHQGATGDAHDEQGRTRGRVLAQALQRQRPDGRPDQGVGQAQQREEEHRVGHGRHAGPAEQGLRQAGAGGRAERNAAGKQQAGDGRGDEGAALRQPARDQQHTEQIAQHHEAHGVGRQHAVVGHAELAAIEADGVAGDHLDAHIAEQRECAQHHLRVPEHAPARDLAGRRVRSLQLGLAQRREMDQRHEQHQARGHHRVGEDEALRQLIAQGLAPGSVQRGQGRLRKPLHARQDERREHQRHHDAGALVEQAHDGDAHGGALARADADDVGVDGRLHQRHAAGQREQRHQEDGVFTGACRRNEGQRAQGHHAQRRGHAALVADARQDGRRRQGHHGVGDVEGEGHPQRLEVVQLADHLQERNQRAVQPGDETEDEEHQPDEDHRQQHALACGGREGFGVHGNVRNE